MKEEKMKKDKDTNWSEWKEIRNSNFHKLCEAEKNIEISIGLMTRVNDFGVDDMHDNRDEITNTISSLNCVSRNISNAIARIVKSTSEITIKT